MPLPRLLAACLLPLLSTPAPAADPLAELLTGLRRTPPISEPFQEVRYRRALRTPLRTAGTLAWSGGLAFERTVSTPYQETARVTGRTLIVQRPRGGERVIPLARAPELHVLFGGLAAVFSGDAAALQRDFEVVLDGAPRWRLRLAPRDPKLHARVPALELRGEAAQARCLILRQDGADTLTLLGATVAPMPAASFDALIAQHCPTP